MSCSPSGLIKSYLNKNRDMEPEIEVNSWTVLAPVARPIREQVFCIEQNIPLDLEWDEMDAVCQHAVARATDGTPVGTGRLLPDGHIGRMAVLQSLRGQGIGGRILETLIVHATARGLAEVVLHAQESAVGFYLRHGFACEGEPFMEAGIPHRTMRRRLG